MSKFVSLLLIAVTILVSACSSKSDSSSLTAIVLADQIPDGIQKVCAEKQALHRYKSNLTLSSVTVLHWELQGKLYLMPMYEDGKKQGFSIPSGTEVVECDSPVKISDVLPGDTDLAISVQALTEQNSYSAKEDRVVLIHWQEDGKEFLALVYESTTAPQYFSKYLADNGKSIQLHPKS